MIIEALHELTADFSGKVQLFLCFHALDEGVKLQRFGQVDQISQNQTIRAVVIIEMTDHLHVIFDKLKAELADMLKEEYPLPKSSSQILYPFSLSLRSCIWQLSGSAATSCSVTSTMK